MTSSKKEIKQKQNKQETLGKRTWADFCVRTWTNIFQRDAPFPNPNAPSRSRKLVLFVWACYTCPGPILCKIHVTSVFLFFLK